MAELDLPVRGMTCRACEVRVGKALRAVDGVEHVRVSATRGTARVTTSGRVPRPALVDAVAHAGYALGEDDRAWISRDRRVWSDVAAAVVVIAVLAILVRAAGLGELAGGLSAAASGGSLAVVVLLGLTAGVSTCMALVGGLVLAVSARHAERHPNASSAQRMRPHLAFNAGRVLGFGVLGATLGALGSVVRLSGGTLALVTIVVSLAMVAVGLQLTRVSPRLAGRTLALPAGLAARLGLDGASTGGYGDVRSAVLGGLTFLLPCGFTQAVQLYALSTGSPVRAGLVMALFALGTVPGLLGIGGLTSVVRGSFAPRFFRFAGVAVLAFAAVNLSGAVTILAPGRTGGTGPTATAVSANVTLGDGVQVLRTVQAADGYEPAEATVLAGTEVRWEIDSVAPSCASALYAPELGLGTVLLDSGVNVLTFTPQEPGRLYYSCAMGMYTGVIDVIAAPEA
ncbi:sulfite exporter TauE/SafE family protein [Cellulomonas sp. KRMCY2]|uniref:urease accessory protein UreH domain-containing protein n=1 Tax=Cellulomonas sp. KRMCY2 TaxID=1304865 RepID=UPI00045EA96A|nr:sulfite exporter TauE/SafE family protein [Cellulomonas sp. KRMCY2]